MNNGYNKRKGGLGTVAAIRIQQPIDIIHANSSITKRNLYSL